MRASLLAVLLLAACSPESLAALSPAETEGALTELSHDVSVQFEGNTARLLVTRKLRNDLDRYQWTTRRLAVPAEAVATSLRLGVNGRWQPAPKLSTVEAASELWDALTSLGDATPATVGRLEWDFGGADVQLELFAIAPKAIIDVEYQLELPRTYEAGTLGFEYPREDGDALPVFHLALAPQTTVEPVILDEERLVEVGYQLRQPWSPTGLAEVRWATWPAGVDRHAWRLELDVAARLASTPARPNVLFLVDASHSQGPEGVAGQLALVQPFLANAPDAQVEVIVYRRFAERLFGRFVRADEVAGLLASLPPERLAPGNGSNVDAAAALATEVLAGVGGPGRVIMFSDGALRMGLTSDTVLPLLERLAPDVVVHAVGRGRFEYGELSLQRNDGDRLAPVAAAHGGVSADLSGLPAEDANAAQVLLGLLRPVQLDDVALEAEGFEEESFDVPAELAEGTAVRVNALRTVAPETLVLRGRLWAQRIEQRVRVDTALSDRMPALLVGVPDLRESLTDDELREAAHAANAVSPVTSFVSVPDDAAPSFIGTPEGTGYGTGFGLVGSASGCSGVVGCGLRGRLGAKDYRAMVRSALAEAVASCRAQHGELPVELTLEATKDEIVAVEIAAPSRALASCVEEAAWAARLTPLFDVNARWQVEF